MSHEPCLNTRDGERSLTLQALCPAQTLDLQYVPPEPTRVRPAGLTRLVRVDITLCGSYAGNDEVWATSCASKSATCSDHVRTGSNFDEAVWEIKSVKVYSTE